LIDWFCFVEVKVKKEKVDACFLFCFFAAVEFKDAESFQESVQWWRKEKEVEESGIGQEQDLQQQATSLHITTA